MESPKEKLRKAREQAQRLWKQRTERPQQQQQHIIKSTDDETLLSDSEMIRKLQDEKAALYSRLERQRGSLEQLAALIQASQDPLESLPLEFSEITDAATPTPEQAAILTITNLRDQIEAMEDERGEFLESLKAEQHKNEQLSMENEVQASQIALHEELFRGMDDSKQLLQKAELIIKSSSPSHLSSLALSTSLDHTEGSSGSDELPPDEVTIPSFIRDESGNNFFVAPSTNVSLLPEDPETSISNSMLPKDSDYKELFQI